MQITPHPDERLDLMGLKTAARRATSRLRCRVIHTVEDARPTARRRSGHADGRAEHASHVSTGARASTAHPSIRIVPRWRPGPQSSSPAGGRSWPVGSATIDRLLHDGQLELFGGNHADWHPHAEAATRHLSAARLLHRHAPGSAFILAAQSAHAIGTGLLAAQGLRGVPDARSGAIGEALVAQFGPQFRHIDQFRRRLSAMNEPAWRDNRIIDADVDGAIPAVRSLLDTASGIAVGLTIYQ